MLGKRIAAFFGYGPKAPVNPPNFPYNGLTNPYRSKRQWPPDFSKLSHKHQFQLERRIKVRSKLKYARPRWNKGVQIVQWVTLTGIMVYTFFFLDVNQFRPEEERKKEPYNRPANYIELLREGKEMAMGDLDERRELIEYQRQRRIAREKEEAEEAAKEKEEAESKARERAKERERIRQRQEARARVKAKEMNG